MYLMMRNWSRHTYTIQLVEYSDHAHAVVVVVVAAAAKGNRTKTTIIHNNNNNSSKPKNKHNTH